MAYTETTHTSFFSRLGNSFSGIGMGIALFVAGTALLWWNEGDFVATRDALNETQAQTQIVGSADNLGPSFSGKVVHVTGFADTKQVLTDSQFGVSQTAIALTREVEYYQWVERKEEKTQKKLGGGEETVTTYHYDKKWVSEPVDSSTFREPAARERKANTQLITVKDQELVASNVTFGAYRLPDFFVRAISGDRAFDVKMSDEARVEMEKSIFAAHPHMKPIRQPVVPQEGEPVAAVASAPEFVHQQSNVIYVGRTPAAPPHRRRACDLYCRLSCRHQHYCQV